MHLQILDSPYFSSYEDLQLKKNAKTARITFQSALGIAAASFFKMKWNKF